MAKSKFRKEAKGAVADLRAIADRVENLSYSHDAADIRHLADGIEEVFVKHDFEDEEDR